MRVRVKSHEELLKDNPDYKHRHPEWITAMDAYHDKALDMRLMEDLPYLKHDLYSFHIDWVDFGFDFPSNIRTVQEKHEYLLIINELTL